MDWLDGFTFIESTRTLRTDNIPYFLKVIQNGHDNVLHWFKAQDDTTKTLFIQQSVQCYLHLLPSAKVSQGFFKLLMSLPKKFQDEIKVELESSFEHLICDVKSDNSAKTVCEILNQNQVVKEACQNYILPTSNLIAERLEVFVQLSKGLANHQDVDAVYYTLKICIHCLQLCHETFKQCLFSTDDVPSNVLLKSLWERIIYGLLSVFFQNSRQDLLGLVGTAMAMILNLSSSLSEFSTASKDVISMIFAEKDAFTLGSFSIAKPASSPSLDDKNLKALIVIKGLLLTSSKERLCHNNKEPLLLYIFPFILGACRSSQVHHYMAFQVLALWFQKFKLIGIKSFVSQSDAEENINCDSELMENEDPVEITSYAPDLNQIYDCKMCMSSSCPILTSTLSTIWLNWDNPVDGVSESVITIFDCLLNIWSQAVKDQISTYHHLGTYLMKRVLMMSWYTKMRYRPLCILLPFVDVFQLLEDYSDLKNDLLKCMSINSLAAVASDVYKAFLLQMIIQCAAKNTDVLDDWHALWKVTILQGMTSSNHIQRLKVCTYWIPHSLKLIPSSENILLETLEEKMKEEQCSNDRIKYLLAWMTVGRYARDLLGFSLRKQQYTFVQEGLVCLDEETRTEALLLLCNTMRRASPVSDQEINLLKSFITVNLKTDSASFRQNMVSALKKLIIRIRDSCASEIRSVHSSSEFLSNSIGFIDLLFQILLHNLSPGGTYQCRQTTLDLLEALLDLLVYKESNHTKKGKAQEGSNILMEYANNEGKWQFFTLDSFTILLSCLEDGAEDIQTQCYKLLVDYFPWPNALQWLGMQQNDLNFEEMTKPSLITRLTNPKTVCNLMNRALHLSSSPKSYENHSGLLLVSLVMKIFVQNVGLTFKLDSHCGVSTVSLVETRLDIKEDPSFVFLDTLLQLLKESVCASKGNPGMQFKVHPIHGLTQYVTECLKLTLNQMANDILEEESVWRRFLEKLKDLNTDIINLMLEVLSGGGNLDQCPSFAEMGVALENLISTQDEKEEDLTTTLSPDFQLLLSWCWINLKQSCTSLGHVTASALIKEDKSFLSYSIISDIGQTFVKVLTTCRHRGAIEGCRSGFSQYCEALLSSKVESFSNIPKAILDTVVQSLSSNSLTASISRRSAGLPIIVEIVSYQAIKTCYDNGFLTTTVDKLYTIASQSLPSDHSELKDLSQVHAMNILKAVFCDARLALHLAPLLSKLTILVVESFDSPSWAMRNAATQLISTLVMRIFGQRNKTSGSMNLEELNNLHPKLVVYIINKLQSFSSSRNMINPSLYVVLTLLSNLVMSPSHLHHLDCRKYLQSSISYYLENPVHSLRNLSAQAYVALFGLDNVDEKLQEFLTRMTDSKQHLNILHGCLLCVSHLISSDALSKNMQVKAIEYFCDNKDLLNHSSACFLPSSQVTLILQRLLQGLSGNIRMETATVLWSHMESLILHACEAHNIVQAGAAHCITESFKTMTLLASHCQHLQERMAQFICSSLVSSSRDWRESVISTLSHEPFEEYLENARVQEALWHNLMTEDSVSNFTQSCDILYYLHIKYRGLCVLPKGITFLDIAELVKKWNGVDSIKASILLLEGILNQHVESSDLLVRHNMIQVWCDQIVYFGAPFMNENLRLSAARALRMFGKNVLALCIENHSDASFGKTAASIIKAIVQFLEDSENNVRDEASIFVSALMSLPNIHANLAFQELSQYISQHLWFCHSIQNYLCEELFSSGKLTALCQNAVSAKFERLFEPEVDSILLEFHAKIFWAYHTLKSVQMRTKWENHSMQLITKRDEATKELEENFSTIACDLQETPFFNVSNNAKVMASLLGIVLLDTLCQDIASAQNVEQGTELHQVVTSLLQLPNLHPLLKNISTSIVSTQPL